MSTSMSAPDEPVDQAPVAQPGPVEPPPVEPPPVEPPPVEPPPPPRRHRALFWSAVVGALAATGGGGYLAVAAHEHETAPDTVVSDYLAAVARGDAAGALAYGDTPEGAQDLLTADVLARQLEIASISDISVAEVVESGDTARADVSYDLAFADGPQTVEDTIALTRDGRTWRLATVAVPVTFRVTYGVNRATVAGAEVPFDPRLVFPGALPLRFDTANLTLDDLSRVVRFAEDADLAEAAVLSPAGELAVGTALDAAVAACLDGSAEDVTLCPLPRDPRAVPGSLRGTVAEPASEVLHIRMQTSNDGLVRITGELTVSGEYEQLDFNNQRVVKTGDVIVYLLAVCYANGPESMIWRKS